MKLLLAPASYKESMSAREAAEAMARGARAADPRLPLELLPVADGGEGTLDTLVFSGRGVTRAVEVTGARGEPVTARIGLLPDGSMVVEAAEAVGLARLPPERRDPRLATSRGVGEMIRAALDLGATRIVVGLGGSATNDGGAGALRALGAVLLDASGQPVEPGGAALARLASADLAGLDPRLARVPLAIACDVRSPLCGDGGASRLFGPQKGATPAVVEELEAALGHFGRVLERALGRELAEVPGAGAAGGLGAGLLASGGRLVPGAELVLQAIGFDRHLGHALGVLTGEGALDGQTPQGKAIAAIVSHAYRARVPVIALAGRLVPGYEALFARGLTSAFSIVPGPCDLATARAEGAANLEAAARAVVRLTYNPAR